MIACLVPRTSDVLHCSTNPPPPPPKNIFFTKKYMLFNSCLIVTQTISNIRKEMTNISKDIKNAVSKSYFWA